MAFVMAFISYIKTYRKAEIFQILQGPVERLHRHIWKLLCEMLQEAIFLVTYNLK